MVRPSRSRRIRTRLMLILMMTNENGNKQSGGVSAAWFCVGHEGYTVRGIISQFNLVACGPAFLFDGDGQL